MHAFHSLQLGWTALHHAARNGQLDICKLLVTHDAKSDIENSVSMYIYINLLHPPGEKWYVMPISSKQWFTVT